MHHSVKVTLILEIRFVKPDEQQIVEVAGFFLKFGDNRDFQLSFAGRLISEQCLAGAVIVVFFRHIFTSRA